MREARQIFHIYWHLTANGVTKPWPNEIRCRYSDFVWPESVIDLEAGLFDYWFKAGEPAEAAFLQEIAHFSIVPRLLRTGAWNPAAIEVFPYYHLTPRDETMGLCIGAEGMERQKECGFPPGRYYADENGCAVGKRQLKKLRLRVPGKLRKKDFCGIGRGCDHGFDLPLMDCNATFIISRRLRDALVANAVSGVEIVPVLDGKREWSEEELRYDVITPEQEADAPCFQLTVTGRPAIPLPLAEEPTENWYCRVCDHGGYEKAEPDWSRVGPGHFAPVDLQAVGPLRAPSGRLIHSVTDSWPLIASARLTRILAEGKFNGFTGGALKGSKLEPVLYNFGDEE